MSKKQGAEQEQLQQAVAEVEQDHLQQQLEATLQAMGITPVTMEQMQERLDSMEQMADNELLPTAEDDLGDEPTTEYVNAVGPVQPVGEVGPALEFSEHTDQLLPQLLLFHAACDQMPGMDGFNPFYKSRFVRLATMIECVRPHLVEAGLVVIHGTRILSYQVVKRFDKDKRSWVEALCARFAVSMYVMHASSGQWVRNTIVMDSADTGMHAMKACATFGRRTNYECLLDIAGVEDNDGSAPEPRGGDPRRTRTSSSAASTPRAAGPSLDEQAQLRKDAKAFMDECKQRTEGDAEAAGQLFTECASYRRPSDNSNVRVTTTAQIVNRAHLDAAWAQLREHKTFGDQVR